MEQRHYTTALGDIRLWGEERVFERSERPLLVALTGAFAVADGSVTRLQRVCPDLDVIYGHLPGNHSPPLMVTSIGAFAAAWSQVLDENFADRRVVLVGESIGGLVALAIKAAPVKALVAIEPPLVTGKLWPLARGLRTQYPDPASITFIEAVFGYMASGVESRDYRHLLAQLHVPAWIILGQEALGASRAIERLPSLVDEPERTLLKDHRLITTLEIPGAGHNVFVDLEAVGQVMRSIRLAVAVARA